MNERQSEKSNPISDTLREHELANAIHHTLTALSTAEASEIIDDSLRGLLSATKIQSFQLYHQRLNLLLSHLEESDKTASPHVQAAITKAREQLQTLVAQRQVYFNRLFSYVQFWSEDTWPHLNLLFLIVPYIVGIFVPPVGIGMLIFNSIYTGASLIDFSVQNELYWQDIPGPCEPPLTTDEKQTLAQEADQLLPAPLPIRDAFDKGLEAFAYYGDIIAIAACVIGLLSLAFPPIGIPALVLTILVGVSVVIGVGQLSIVIKRWNRERHAQETLKAKIEDDKNRYRDGACPLLSPIESIENKLNVTPRAVFTSSKQQTKPQRISKAINWLFSLTKIQSMEKPKKEDNEGKRDDEPPQHPF